MAGIADAGSARLLTHPLICAGAVAVLGPVIGRILAKRGTFVHFLTRFCAFALLTYFMLAGGISPAGSIDSGVNANERLVIASLEIVWWLTGAWLLVSLVHWLVTLRSTQQSKLFHDLFAALIYCVAIFSILGHVLDLPIKGLLATSGALAIIIGLALQNSLGDVFSGIVLTIEKPYRTGDWIVIDDSLQGKVIEANWRATHILTATNDVAIVPNSVIAKSKLVNCSNPTAMHGASVRIKLQPTQVPAAARRLLEDVLRSTGSILRTPPPSATVKDISAEFVDYELSYSVADIGKVGEAQNELFDRLQRAVAAAGMPFALRDSAAHPPLPAARSQTQIAERLISCMPLFASLTPEEAAKLASQMQRQTFEANSVIVEADTVIQFFYIVVSGIVGFAQLHDGIATEIGRLAAGDYFGELGLLTGKSTRGRLTAVSEVSLYRLSKEALAPILHARPLVVEELSESLATRQSILSTLLEGRDAELPRNEGKLEHIARTIRRLLLDGRHS